MRPISSVIALLVVLAQPAFADETTSYRAVVDQVTLEPASLGGQRLRVLLSIMSLQGQVLDAPEASSIKLVVNGGTREIPVGVGQYGGSDSDTAIIFVVQVSFDFTDVLPVIAEAIDTNVLVGANERTQVALLTYGESQGAGKLSRVKAARGKFSGIASDGSVGEPLLLDTLERALGMLKKARTDPEDRPLRKMIVVIGDGRDSSSERDRVIRIGTRAAKDDIRIHSFAFSPKDIRRPLLLLGELSKRSYGTFRWIRGAKADSWTPAFQQLQAEIARQLVLVFFLGKDDDVASGKLKISTTGRNALTSVNEHKIPEPSCAGQTCEPGMYCAADRCVAPREAETRGVIGWILLILGIIVGAIVVLGLIGFVITKRQQAVAARPVVPVVPGSIPPKVASIAPAPATAPAVAAAPVAQGARPRFYIMSGPRTGEELVLKHGFFVGKTPTCDLVIDDGYTSAHHAQITMDQFGNCRVHDYNSTNGTFVNGVRITEAALEHGHTVKIGSIELRFLAQ